MTISQSRLRLRRFPAIAGAGVLLLLASGCATTSAASGSPTPSADETVPVETSTAQTTDEDTCLGYADVVTMMTNAQAAATDGRMSDPELQGWLRLATRVQDGISSTGEGPISDALGAVKVAAPALPPGSTETPGLLSDQWMTAATDLREACDAAGYDVSIESFVGG